MGEWKNSISKNSSLKYVGGSVLSLIQFPDCMDPLPAIKRNLEASARFV
jgi:hypothetical protein